MKSIATIVGVSMVSAFSVSSVAKVPMTTQERAFTSPIWYSP